MIRTIALPRLSILTLCLVLPTTAGAEPDPVADVTSKLAAVEAEIEQLRKAGPAKSATAARYADELARELKPLRGVTVYRPTDFARRAGGRRVSEGEKNGTGREKRDRSNSFERENGTGPILLTVRARKTGQVQFF